MIHRKVLLPVVIITSFLLILGSCASNPDQKAEDSREGDLHYQMGVTYLNKGNVEMALFELSKAVRLKPRDAEVRFALGTIYLFKGEPE
ncbi:MAG: tetratricopeptide repeat protein, partial [bacterium]